MNTLIHIWILGVDEFTQLFFRRRAIIALALYAFVVCFVVYGFHRADHTVNAYLTEQGMPEMKGDEVLKKMGDLSQLHWAKTILNWPLTFPLFQFLAIFWMTELIAIMSCDIVSGDRERGTLRFLFLRTSRSAFYAGRFLAHLLLYVILHVLSLALLTVVTVWSSEKLTYGDCITPLLAYSWALIPLIILSLCMTLFASSISSSIVGSLLKLHLLWIPVFFVILYDLHPMMSWRTLTGIVVPLDQFATANILGNVAIALTFFLLGFLIFRRSEV